MGNHPYYIPEADFDGCYPAVGGPAHGFFYTYDGTVNRKEISVPADASRNASSMNLSEVAPVTVQFGYKLEPFAITMPGMRLEGRAWVWDRLEPSEVVTYVVSLLLARAMGVRR